MASRPVHPLLVAFLALLLVGTCQARPAPGKAASSSSSEAKGAVVDGITDIYNFGDSISNTGNFLALMEHTVAPPYCSDDGYLMIDYLANDLGLPLLNPYIDKGADFFYGVNFAVTGATALDAAALARIGVTAPRTNNSPTGAGRSERAVGVRTELLALTMHNVLLQQGIRELRRSYPEATIAYADYSGAYVRMLEGARDTGFDGVALTKACCGGKYNFEMERMCGAGGTAVCARPEERISWDGVAST
uniref:Uncharacterized protein n=1 Tax=Oryza barthii TaxID=65489 RepID=A0A0D3F7B5_9ORYZ